MSLTLEERTKIFDKVCRLVETKHFNPSMNGVDWNALANNRRDQILASTDPETFEKEVQGLVAELKTSHTGFRHAGMRNIPARHAINATMQRIAIPGFPEVGFPPTATRAGNGISLQVSTLHMRHVER